MRTSMHAYVLGNDLSHIGDKHKPSTGLYAVIYGVFVGAPEIVVSGISVVTEGYSHSAAPGVQLHRAEDLFALRHFAQTTSAVRTTEIEVAASTGLPLWTAAGTHPHAS